MLVAGTALCPMATCEPLHGVRVGVYYYPWYKEAHYLQHGVYHWNASDEYPNWNISDTPLLGYYSCQNESVIKQQLDWMAELGIDFIIFSWWGNDMSGSSYEDESCQFIFSQIKQHNYNITATLMVESFNETYGTYDYQYIYDYVYDTYVVPYNEVYMKLDKPLLCFFNGENLTRNGTVEQDDQNRFSVRIIGHESYVDWVAWPVAGYAETPSLNLSKDGFVGILPRYDDTYIRTANQTRYDPEYTNGLYDKQWNEVNNLSAQNDVNYVAIYSWNEYHERSQIEPHMTLNGEIVLSPFYKTYHYVQIVIPEFPSIATLSILMSTVLITLVICRPKRALHFFSWQLSNLRS